MKQLSIEQARELYSLGGRSKEIAVELFPELSERKLPISWMQFWNPVDTPMKQVYVPENMEDAFDALVKLLLLKQEYNGEWVADWKDDTTKYCISFFADELDIETYEGAHCFLAFKTAELRDEFAANFKELIEAAKPLLG